MSLKLIVIIAFAALMISCGDKTTVNQNNNGIKAKLVSIGPCDTSLTIVVDPECLSYEYKGTTLNIVHENAVYNCCKDTIIGSININNSIITITEEEVIKNGCFCVCKYDLNYSIENIPSGIYTIIYKGTGYEINLTADLAGSSTGKKCLD